MDSEFFCVFTERHRVPSLFDCIKPPCHVAASGESLCNICRRAEPDEEGGAGANRLNKLLPEQAPTQQAKSRREPAKKGWSVATRREQAPLLTTLGAVLLAKRTTERSGGRGAVKRNKRGRRVRFALVALRIPRATFLETSFFIKAGACFFLLWGYYDTPTKGHSATNPKKIFLLSPLGRSAIC